MLYYLQDLEMKLKLKLKTIVHIVITNTFSVDYSQRQVSALVWTCVKYVPCFQADRYVAGVAVVQIVEPVTYYSEGRWFDPSVSVPVDACLWQVTL